MRVSPVLFVASSLLALSVLLFAQERPPEGNYSGRLQLVRYDMPKGLSDGYAPTRQLAKRLNDNGEAVDWPDFTLNGKALFRQGPEETVSLRLRKGREAASPFRVEEDYVVHPGGHWFRPISQLGRQHLYTADKTARTASPSNSATGGYELWTFPLRIRAEGAPAVKNVVLKYAGGIVYKRHGPWRTLTLLLPGTEPGRQYELSVDGRAMIRFDLGLMPVKLGTPREQLYEVNTTLPGNPKIVVATLSRPDEFPNLREWQADIAALAKPQPDSTAGHPAALEGISRWLGNQVNRSGVTTYAMALPLVGTPAGFTGKGSRAFGGTLEEYGQHLGRMKFDAVFDPGGSLPAPDDVTSFEARAAVLAKHGIQLGVQYDHNWTRPALQHPNLAFLSHNLPEWHAPLHRSLSLTAQRFSRFDNFAGIAIGSDNAGFAAHRLWGAPSPEAPWGEAMVEFMGSPQPRVPRAPQLGPPEGTFEVPVKTTAEFIRYASRYEATFQQYGYFAEAVKDVDPSLVFTTASFGSSPARGSRGGWPWASIPGRVMFENMPVQQAFDRNDSHAAKPMHLVALIDRLRSYQPTKKTWALLDNLVLGYGREAYQRAVALAFTRGIDGLGTNMLPAAKGETARPDVVAYVAEMNDWARRFGGVISRSEPIASIGVFYGQHQAIQRPVLTAENPPEEKLYDGSHEGKVTEALFMCHAAGWPARVITYQELMRGPLPSSMKAILLVGLDVADSSWTWCPELEKSLGEFTARGGLIITDSTSFSPVPSEKTQMRMASYVSRSPVDATSLLLRRNAENIAILRKVMERVPPPIATTDQDDVWAIPTRCGDVQFITIVNQGTVDGPEASEYAPPHEQRPGLRFEPWKTKANASLYVKPQVAKVHLNTDRPAHDLRSGETLSAADAVDVDLTSNGFQYLAILPRDFSGLEILVQAETRPGRHAFYEALVTTSKPEPIRGVPVKIEISAGDQSAEIFAATGWPVRLPLSLSDKGDWTIRATDLITNKTVTTKVNVPGPIENLTAATVRITDARGLDRFATRKHVALRICLTPEQEKDARIRGQAESLLKFYRERGRIASMSRVAPGGVVESLQPLKSPHRYPQWKTVPADLVLFGDARSNVLIMDQARAHIFPKSVSAAGDKVPALVYTRSPFVGEYDAVNIIAADHEGISTGVKAVINGTKEEIRLAR